MARHPDSPRCSRILLTAAVVCVASAAIPALADQKAAASAARPPEPMTSLWVEPADPAARDLFYGPGGKRLVPRTDVAYQFRKEDTTGHSGGYDVEDPDGRKWDVKIGDEAQSEIVVSRILWAIGYHQPAIYYVPRWRMAGGPTEMPKPGRFRLKSDHKKEGDWSWKQNPFVGTRPFRGLLVANVLLNNWDLATSNNRIYRLKDARGPGATWYVVQDVGAGLGGTLWTLGSRNNLRDFENQDFVTAAKNGRVKFDYHSGHKGLLSEITAADVVWTCRLMARLSDRQLHDAFRAAGYPQDVADRFVRKIEQKIQEGLALATQPGEAG